tara:strand:+ start:827 stop:1417 length:591 start_codon:yes stop_codon:yes gene_type:complete
MTEPWVKTYTIPIHFSGIAPNIAQLGDEIEASVDITTSFLGITTEYDDVNILFSLEISPTENTALDNLVGAHVPIFIPNTNSILPIMPRTTNIRKTTYQRVATFRFPGSTFARANSISHMDIGATSYDIRITDKDNGQVLLTRNLTNTEESRQDLGVLSNLSTTETILQVYVKRNGGSNNHRVCIENVNIEYVSIR